MIKLSGFLITLFCLCTFVHAEKVPVKTPALVSILTTKQQKARDKALIAHLKGIFRTIPITELSAAKQEVHDLLLQYHIDGVPALDYFIESECLQRENNPDSAEKALVKSIVQAAKTSDHYLQYSLYSHLAFLQTFKGNTIDAVSNFGMAKKEAITANDPDLQVVIDINISDIYYKNNLFIQSLSYLNHADSLFNTGQSAETRLKNIVYFNKAEIYFRMNAPDSLKKYNNILNGPNIGAYKIYIYRKRVNYYLSILQRDYKGAVKQLTALQRDTHFGFDASDAQCLADAYYHTGMPDSAKAVINRLLSTEINHPEITFHLYEVLGNIAENENDYQQAAKNYKLTIQQLEDQVSRLTKVGGISAEMRVDDMKGDYIRKEEALKRQRLYLLFAVIFSILAIVIVAISYRNIKQKRFYEKLLFAAKKEELSFINSHEVRRHLANILGIIGMIKNSDDKQEDYLLAEEHLITAAENLDEAIKNISETLDKA